MDLEDCPAIDAQHPPDLRQYVPEAPSGAPESEQAAAAKAAAAAAIAGQTCRQAQLQLLACMLF